MTINQTALDYLQEIAQNVGDDVLTKEIRVWFLELLVCDDRPLAFYNTALFK